MDTQTLLTSPALRQFLTSFIAEAVAAADLPPLTEPDDREFLRAVLENVIYAFWEAYVSRLSEDVQLQLLAANDDETGEKIWAWLSDHADFAGDENARSLAQEIWADFAKTLPQAIADARGVWQQSAILRSTPSS